jgi:putative heme-binding domain-containing protein
VETKNGDAFSGFLLDRTEAGLTLKLATGQEMKIPADEIGSTKPQPISLMPAELLNLLTEQEAVDLLSYLESLR